MDEKIKALARQIDVMAGTQSIELHRSLEREKLMVPIDQYAKLLEMARLARGERVTVVAPSQPVPA